MRFFFFFSTFFFFVSGSPAYDSIRSLSYHDAHVFLLCYKISDPISLYNIKNKWIVEIKKHRPDMPVILCGCQADLRKDPVTIAHLSKTGRAPVSREQALAICCEISAVNYVETSAKMDNEGENLAEVFEVCALAGIKHRNVINNNNGSSNFKRSPSIHSTLSLSLFPDSITGRGQQAPIGAFKRSPSTNSNLSLAANFKMPTLAFKRSSAASVTSLRSPTSDTPAAAPTEARFLRTFSPEPLNPANSRIPPVISEHEAYQETSSSSTHLQSGGGENMMMAARRNLPARPSSMCEQFPVAVDQFPSNESRLQRPTTLFKGDGLLCPRSRHPFPSRGAAFFSPGGTPSNDPMRFANFDSMSELGTPSSVSSNSFIKSPQMDVVWPTNAQVRPNGLSRRTSYRTHPKMAIPVATPMSPVGSELSFDMRIPPRSSCQSPQSTTSESFMQNCSFQELSSISEDLPSDPCSNQPTHHPTVFDLKPKIYESLKSHVSVCSQSSDGSSKLPSDFSDSSSISCKAGNGNGANDLVAIGLDQKLPNTEDPELLNSLNFVSPKTGVYRPSSRKAKHNCAVM